mmetsp:Transcript_70801/g.124953  ORF Transcript_70801/g.124953 Transcript_70801/m.124953 type:complete len:217 (-) Transcript_70801:12-662(-)
MRQHALHWLHTEVLGNLCEGLGDLRVRVTNLHQSKCGLCGVPRSVNDICLLVLDLLSSNNDCVSCSSDETIDVACQVDLGDVPGFQLPRLTLQRGEVAQELVHRDASREGYALLYLSARAILAAILDLLVVELACLFFQDFIAQITNSGDVCIRHAGIDHFLQGLVDNITRSTILRRDIWVAQVADLLVLRLVVGHCRERQWPAAQRLRRGNLKPH